MMDADLDRMVAQAEYEYSLVLQSVAPEYRQRLEEIIELTDVVCINHLAPLAREYETYCHLLAACCCQKGSPVVERRGKPAGWAAGILWTLGMVNFLDDKSFEPVMNSKQMAAAFGVSVATMQAKSREIREGLDIRIFDPEWTLPSLYDKNPLAWIVETKDGLLVDVRQLPREQQQLAFERGMIPYVPVDQNGDHDAADDS
jgi:hypothetical protein